MEKLNEKKKHNHKLTNLLKASIFSIVMLAPFFSVLSRVIYVQANPNANLSYYGNTINEQQYNSVISYSQLKLGKSYHFQSMTEHKTITNTNSYYIGFNNIRNIITSYPNLTDISNVNGIRLSDYTSNYALLLNTITNEVLYTININTYSLIFDFDLTTINLPSDTPLTSYFDNTLYDINYNNYSYLDNAFEYSIEQLHQSPVYNWAKNTGIYTAIDNMTTGLEMGANNTLALLLAYWSILTAVYIVFDIVIVLFTKLTHMISE